MTSLNQEGEEGQRPREEVLEGIIDIFNEKGKAFGCWEGLLSSTLLDNSHDEYDVAQNSNCKLQTFFL